MATWDKTISRKVYEERFFSGQKFVRIVANLLKAEGFTVRTPLQRVKSLRKANKDSGDIHIMVGETTRFIVEVKSRRIVFSSIGDYPFKEVFIDNCSQWNNKKFRVAAIVIISQITEAMFVVPMSSKKYWFTSEITDEEKQVRVWKYLVDKQFCISFESMAQKLKDKLKGE